MKIGSKVTVHVGDHRGKRGRVISYETGRTYPALVKVYDGISIKCLWYRDSELEPVAGEVTVNGVVDPQYYSTPAGGQVIDLAEYLTFNRGNAVKYLARAGRKPGAGELDDLRKAEWYIKREIQRIKEGNR
ncbi:DUF3310 domain-containing protein [Streptomyces sp. NPDC005955]|uniref:DUF3310 domain-containing protein n=1 Tax=Streptomyces sp. NPDC005955 TaxID=3364738 RepID=UPI00367F8A0A